VTRIIGLLVGLNAALGIAAWFGLKFTGRSLRDFFVRLLGKEQHPGDHRR
jgi:hypothetical protein